MRAKSLISMRKVGFLRGKPRIQESLSGMEVAQGIFRHVMSSRLLAPISPSGIWFSAAGATAPAARELGQMHHRA
jgi:hypothetical protein